MAGLLALGCSGSSREEITVAAATDLRFAFQDIAERFEEETGVTVRVVLGSSGQLQQQVVAGAPYDVFASADTQYVDELAARGLVLPETQQSYGLGRLALVTRAGLGVRLESLTDLLRPEVRRVAIANPEHAPYGRAAEQALRSAGVWEDVQPKLLYGENVRQALTFVLTGDADGALVALSLVVAPGLAEGVSWVTVDPDLYEPLVQAMAVVARSQHRQAAERFVAFVNGPEGQALLRRYGFLPPGESP